MKKVFLDCGTNLCQGLNQISEENKIDETWIVYSFDCNPEVFNYIDKNKHKNVNFINEGVWIESCERFINQEVLDVITNKDIKSLNGEKFINAKIGGSTNIMDDAYKWGHWIESDKKLINSLKVKCFDFSSFIKDNFNKEDYIVVKLDIEGAEYEVMDKLISDNTIDYIDSIYVEWHNINNRNRNYYWLGRKCSSLDYYINIINEKNIRYTEWH
jgi:FkbM family methyltransferase